MDTEDGGWRGVEGGLALWRLAPRSALSKQSCRRLILSAIIHWKSFPFFFFRLIWGSFLWQWSFKWKEPMAILYSTPLSTLFCAIGDTFCSWIFLSFFQVRKTFFRSTTTSDDGHEQWMTLEKLVSYCAIPYTRLIALVFSSSIGSFHCYWGIDCHLGGSLVNIKVKCNRQQLALSKHITKVSPRFHLLILPFFRSSYYV